MRLSFDLISDLHLDNWHHFDWTNQATSELCVVAGDIAKDRSLLKKSLEHLGKNYKTVFFIDGNEEHRNTLSNLDQSYLELKKLVKDIPNVVYLHNCAVIINGVAFIATNSWWTFDFDSTYSISDSKLAFEKSYAVDSTASNNIYRAALNDARYLEHTISKLQVYQDIKKIVIISHTVPNGDLIKHDKDLSSNYRINTSTNSLLQLAIDSDTEKKIGLWCFGHYHVNVDTTIDNIRYVCNPRGRLGTPWHRDPYYPVRIEV